jgi:histidine ammonia-lyase
MLLRLNTLAKGFSGVRLVVAQLLQSFLNEDIHPIIPSRGSVGASGDLAPPSHMALSLMGEGVVEFHGKREMRKRHSGCVSENPRKGTHDQADSAGV